MLTSLVLTSLEIGSVLAVAVLGLVVSFRVVGFPDLTTEGSFTAGAAIAAVSIAAGAPPAAGLLLSVILGAAAGMCTGLLHTKAQVSKLLAGIIVMTVLYTVNLRIMGRANYSLLGFSSVFEILPGEWGLAVVALLSALLVACILWWLLKTDFGLFLRAAGENPSVVTRAGAPLATFTVIGLALANALIGLSGGLLAQLQGFADVGMGVGLIVVGLAALLIGETLVRPSSIPRVLIGAIVGACVYQLVIAAGLRLGIGPWDMKMATGVLLALSVVLKSVSGARDTAGIGARII